MKKTIVTVLGLLLLKSMVAQTDSTVNVSEVAITAQRIETPVLQATHSVSVVTAEEIKNLPVQSVSSILSYVGGVDVRQRGPQGSQADIGIRGGNFDQTLVLIDGVKVLAPQTGHHLMNLPINVEYIERIEVIRGGGAMAYGANAFGGVINILTKKVEGKSASAKVFAGDYGFGGGSINAATGSAKTKQFISLDYTTSSGYQPGNDFGNTGAFYKLNHTITPSLNVDFVATGSQRNMGAAGYYVANSSEYEETQTVFSFAKVNYNKNNLKLTGSLGWRYNDDRYVYIRLKPEVFQNHHHTHVMDADIQGTYKSVAGITGFGINARQDEIYSNNLGTRKRTFYNISVEHQYTIAGFVINPGVNFNYVSTYNWQAFPALHLSKQFLRNFIVYASANKSYRVPTYTDLYYRGPSNIGNPDLQPEQAWNYEGGIKYAKGKWYAQGGVFQRQSTNLIDWVRTADTLPFQPRNFHEVTFEGVEGEVTRRNLWFLQQLTVSYTGIRASFTLPQGYLSRYSLNHIKNQVQARATVKFLKNFYFTAAYRYVERNNLGAYHLLDARIEYKHGKHSIFADVNNLTNTDYTEAGFVPMPGRWIWGGVKVNLW